MTTHDKECGKYCPYPDTSWISPGAALPKCRGGDCTLCDELECTCGAFEENEELEDIIVKIESIQSVLAQMSVHVAHTNQLVERINSLLEEK